MRYVVQKGEVTLLLVTDVAARGLDIEDLPLVVTRNYHKVKTMFMYRSYRSHG